MSTLCARPGCALPVGKVTRRTTEAQAKLCPQHRHVQAVVESLARRIAAGWVPTRDGAVRTYGCDVRGAVLRTPAGARWLLVRCGRVVASRGLYAAQTAAERACDAARASKGAGK